MRRGLWVGAAVLLALVAAIPLWLALDGDGERRAAALQEPTSSGDVATLTLTSAASGTLAIPVQSFSLSMTSPRDAASGLATGQPRYGPLRILKQVDASSPALFKMVVNNEGITAATLETKDSLGRSVLSYSFTNARVSRWQDGKREELEIHYEEMTSSVGTLPKGGTAGIGVMSAPTLGAGKVSIQDFVTGVVSPTEAATGLASGKRQHKPVMVLRSLHPTWPMLHTKIRNSQNSSSPK